MNRRSATRLIGSLVGIAGVAFSLTLLFRSMRSVQSIGGFCASGGSAYQIANHCPKGIAGLLPLSIFGGLLFLGLFAVCAGDTGRSLLWLAWPALFLSLGWNFLDYGLHLTTTGSGVDAGFLVCGVLFIVMGAVPLIWLLPILWNVVTGHADSDTTAGARKTPVMGYTSVRFTPSSPPRPAPVWGTGVKFDPPPTSAPTTTASTGRDVASELERLASLHRRGELTDVEYDAAKQRAIAGNPT